ncbi:copper resistance CopC family protein [Streptomyces sp. YIM 130001]|uniref:copper resistance CopC family protein n=1 Tax=Streptomyces sp. YIM 130001 TaxID=2259644 RepID=UPI0013C478C7|nr:copper resistance CopC family protein [Streptomyces sp. YIM 130001]
MFVATALSVVLSVLMPAHGVSAHSALQSSTPQLGEHLASMPPQIELRFAEPVKDIGAKVTLADEQGKNWAAGSAVVDAAVVSSGVRSDIPDGRYEVRWRSVSGDGAPMSGVVRFALGNAKADSNPLHAVLTARDAFWIQMVAFAVVGAFVGYTAYGLVTVYGRRSRPRRTD